MAAACPTERSTYASAGAHAAHAKYGPAAMTRNAHLAANETRFADELDPERKLPPDELAKRVEHARRAHMKSLSVKAVLARKAKAAATAGKREAVEASRARNAKASSGAVVKR